MHAFRSANNPHVGPLQAALFAKYGLSHRLADAAEWSEFLHAFRNSTSQPLRRQAMRDQQAALAADLRGQVISKLKAWSTTSPISLAIDGWTNTRHHKVTNLLCLCGGQAYYWCSIVNRYDKNTAAWLRTPIAAAITDLNGRGIRITALVADNEAVNGKLYRLLKPQFPYLLLCPCAAHTIQLCVNKAMLEPGIFDVMKTIEDVVKQFRKGKALRLKLANVQREAAGESKVKALVIPCDTRWSSHRAAGLRLLELKSYITLCDLPNRPVESFWAQLRELVDFLKPFQTSTDIIQADNSTLYSVYRQFVTLLAYVDGLDVTNTFYAAKAAIHNIIVSNWEQHVNKPAALMCAWFSFDDGVRDFDTADLTAAKTWFIDYAVAYAAQYNLMPGWDEARVRGELNELWGHFTGRAVNSPFAALDELVASMRATQLQKNVRVVDGQTSSTWYPVTVWRNLESEVPLLAHPAIALLCVAGSEAAVERSFSAQDAIHTKKRNRLADSTVQNEMFIRFNADAVNGKRPGGATRVLGGTCVELTMDYQEKPSSHGSVKELFKTVAVAEVEQEAEPAAAAAEDSQVELSDSEAKDDASSGSESDVSSEAAESDGGSEVSQSSEEPAQPLSRSATIARQVALDSFIADFKDKHNLTRGTKWRSGDLDNLIQRDAISARIRMTVKDLKPLIKRAVLGSQAVARCTQQLEL